MIYYGLRRRDSGDSDGEGEIDDSRARESGVVDVGGWVTGGMLLISVADALSSLAQGSPNYRA
jgi:hypothetical protein